MPLIPRLASSPPSTSTQTSVSSLHSRPETHPAEVALPEVVAEGGPRLAAQHAQRLGHAGVLRQPYLLRQGAQRDLCGFPHPLILPLVCGIVSTRQLTGLPADPAASRQCWTCSEKFWGGDLEPPLWLLPPSDTAPCLQYQVHWSPHPVCSTTFTPSAAPAASKQILGVGIFFFFFFKSLGSALPDLVPPLWPHPLSLPLICSTTSIGQPS